MGNQGIMITDLRPEILTLVNSDPTKYNPNKNEYIDDGDELSQLLSEYQCTREDLTKKGGKTMLTCAEKIETERYVDNHTDGKIPTALFLGLPSVGAVIGSIAKLAESTDKGFFKVVKDAGKVTKALSPCFKTAIFSGGLAIALGVATAAIFKMLDKSAEKTIINHIKARQTEDGERIMAQRRKEEAERAQREAALKQEELEYRERMDNATQGIQNNISNAERKAKNVNRELDKMQEKVAEEQAE